MIVQEEHCVEFKPPSFSDSAPSSTPYRAKSIGGNSTNAVALYRAALQGNWPHALGILEVHHDWIRRPISPTTGETVLHIAAAAKHTHFVQKLCTLLTPEDLTIQNYAGNTALCMAAASGVVEIAKVMVDMNKSLPDIRGNDGVVPLQVAVSLGHRDMVWYLLPRTCDNGLTDKDFIEIITSSIDSGLYDVAFEMLVKDPSLASMRNGKEETALHALARKPLPRGAEHSWSKRTRHRRLGGKLAQIKVLEPTLEIQLVRNLWNVVIDCDASTISDLISRPWNLMFVAARCGNIDFLIASIRSYPDLIWQVDEENRSIFHIAVMQRQEEIFKLIHEFGAIKQMIAVKTDHRNNNMLHLAGLLAPSHRLNCVSGAALQMQRELLWFKAVEEVVRPDYLEAENSDRLTPRALFTEMHEDLRAKGEEWMKKTAESCTLVATLIATVVFAAAFTVPGGNNDGGLPIFVDSPVFMVYAISNAISLLSSSSSILIFLSILTSRYAEGDFLLVLPYKLMLGLTWLFASIATMVVAFTTTFFISFREVDKWIPVTIAMFGSIPVGLFVFQQYPLLLDIYRSAYKSSLFWPTKSKLFPIFSTDEEKKMIPFTQWRSKVSLGRDNSKSKLLRMGKINAST